MVGSPRWAFGGCCTPVVVSLDNLPYISRQVRCILSGISTVIIGILGRGGIDRDVLDLTIAQRTESYVHQSYSV